MPKTIGKEVPQKLRQMSMEQMDKISNKKTGRKKSMIW